MHRAISRHRPVLVVLAKLVAVYAAWYVVYDLWLLPDGRLDDAVAHNAAALAAGVLDLLGLAPAVEGRVVRMPSGSGVWVADACTGLGVVGLFAGFVLAYPGPWRRRLWFVPLGALAVHLANVVRIAALAWLRDAQPGLFDPAHQWGGTPFFYAVVFGLWMVWVRLGEEAEDAEARVEAVPAGAG